MIYFLRHQKTENNLLGYISGQSDSPILRDSINADSEIIPQCIEMIYTSPSQRCMDTLLHLCELPTAPIMDNRLVERNMGDFENHSRRELYLKYPNFFWNEDGKITFRYECTPPNGESLTAFSERIYSFCKEVIQPNRERNILVCSHNQTMKMMWFVLKDSSPTKESWSKLTFPNGKYVAYENIVGLF